MINSEETIYSEKIVSIILANILLTAFNALLFSTCFALYLIQNNHYLLTASIIVLIEHFVLAFLITFLIFAFSRKIILNYREIKIIKKKKIEIFDKNDIEIIISTHVMFLSFVAIIKKTIDPSIIRSIKTKKHFFSRFCFYGKPIDENYLIISGGNRIKKIIEKYGYEVISYKDFAQHLEQ